jgi:hypothetical protein
MVFAMPIASGNTVAKAANAQVVPARGGCGPRRHRGPRGGCRWKADHADFQANSP